MGKTSPHDRTEVSEHARQRKHGDKNSGIGDIVDGSIARRLGEESTLGTRLDSADGLAAFVTLPVLFLTNLSIAAEPACILVVCSILQESHAVFAR